MKYEIDITNPAALREAECELKRLLKIVQFALEGIEKKQAVEEKRPGSNVVTVSTNTSEKWISDALDAVGNQFKSSEVYRYMEKHHPAVTRDMMKGSLRDRVRAGKLIVVQNGKGRMPTIYVKA